MFLIDCPFIINLVYHGLVSWSNLLMLTVNSGETEARLASNKWPENGGFCFVVVGGGGVCLLIDTSSSLGILPTSSSLVTFEGRYSPYRVLQSEASLFSSNGNWTYLKDYWPSQPIGCQPICIHVGMHIFKEYTGLCKKLVPGWEKSSDQQQPAHASHAKLELNKTVIFLHTL